jgi:hypothetical protein
MMMSIMKVKTFTNELKVLHTMHELQELDDQVNRFIRDNNVEKIVSVSDALTTDKGGTIGIVRVVAYKSLEK